MHIETGLTGIHVNFSQIIAYEDWPVNYNPSQEGDNGKEIDNHYDPLYPDEQTILENLIENEV